jgi:hypothetical protein
MSPITHSSASFAILRPDVVATVLDKGAVLLDLESKYFYSANAGAWAIIQMFENGAGFEQVSAQCRIWGASDEDMLAVQEVLETLQSERLLEECLPPHDQATTPSDISWSRPALEKHSEPLQKIMVSAFDPSIPLAE